VEKMNPMNLMFVVKNCPFSADWSKPLALNSADWPRKERGAVLKAENWEI
jgi:hypothetical protein